MIDIYLRFETREEALEICAPLNMVYEDTLLTGSHQYSLWKVGEIFGLSGWHINMRINDPNFDTTLLEPYIVNPNNPRCRWA